MPRSASPARASSSMAAMVFRSLRLAKRRRNSAGIDSSPVVPGAETDRFMCGADAERRGETGDRRADFDVGGVASERFLCRNRRQRTGSDGVQNREAEIGSLDGVQAGGRGVALVDVPPERGEIAERIAGEAMRFAARFTLRENPA